MNAIKYSKEEKYTHMMGESEKAFWRRNLRRTMKDGEDWDGWKAGRQLEAKKIKWELV